MRPELVAAATLAFLVVELVGRFRLTRLLWRELARLVILFDLACMRLVQRLYPPRFVLRGGCHQRGACCKQILADPPRFIKNTRLVQLFATYHLVFHRFRTVARGPNGELVFSCGHLQTDGRCGIYRHRPRICRNYPVLPYFKAPQLLPGCGYVVVPRVVDAMQRPKSLPILNPIPAIHHPTPLPRAKDELGERFEDYELVDVDTP